MKLFSLHLNNQRFHTWIKKFCKLSERNKFRTSLEIFLSREVQAEKDSDKWLMNIMYSVGVLTYLIFFALVALFQSLYSHSHNRYRVVYGSCLITHSTDYNKNLLISHPQGRFIHSLKLVLSYVEHSDNFSRGLLFRQLQFFF